ncbi:MAG: alpha/beta hydrolase [Actinobacteria bacterium]|nr:alpha/beta hydrolase [Actinomycetota bacterium]
MSIRIVVVPGPGLDADACLRWGRDLSVEVEVRVGDPAVVIGALAAGPNPTAGIVIAPGADGFDAGALATAVANARVPVVAVDPDNLRKAGLQPEATRLATAGATVLYGRGPDTGRYALLWVARRHGRAHDELAYGPETSQEGDLWCPAGDGPHPVTVLFHGGFWYHAWERDLMDGLAADLACRGIAAWNVEYRRVGAGGAWPATGDDAARATDHLVALAPVYGLDLERVALLGHSAGAQLALWVAARGRRAEVHPALVVGLAAIADLEAAMADRIGGGSVGRLLDSDARVDDDLDVALVEASPRARVPIGVPQLLAHAVDDDVVPHTQTTDYAAAARTAGDDVSVLELPAGGHFDLIDPATDSWAAVVAELQTRLQDQ